MQSTITQLDWSNNLVYMGCQSIRWIILQEDIKTQKGELRNSNTCPVFFNFNACIKMIFHDCCFFFKSTVVLSTKWNKKVSLIKFREIITPLNKQKFVYSVETAHALRRLYRWNNKFITRVVASRPTNQTWRLHYC